MATDRWLPIETNMAGIPGFKIYADNPSQVSIIAAMTEAQKEMLRADDLIMSRILWLDGLERRNANTHDRYVYIHGTNHEDKIGTPDSHGCIRMRNDHVIELFDLVDEGTPVTIHA